MFKNLKLGTKIIAGYLLLVAFVAVTGTVGYWGTKTVARSLVTVGDEEAPVVDMSMEMMLSLMTARDAMSEFQASSATLAQTDEGALAKIEQAYNQANANFDEFGEAILNGKAFDDGLVVIKTDNEKLANLVRQSQQVHDEKFQAAATTMIEAGRELISRKKQADAAMAKMETIFDEVSTDTGQIEEMVSAEIARRSTEGKLGTEALAILREEVPLADMSMELKFIMAQTRICIEEYVQTTETKELDALEAEYKGMLAKFDACAAAILTGGTVDGVKVIATDNGKVREAVKELDENHTAFQEAVKTLMADHRAMIATSHQATAAMAQLDAAGEEADALLAQVEHAASTEMSTAKDEGHAAVSVSVTWIIVTLIAATVIGMLTGIVITRSITKPINQIITGLASGAEQTASAAGQVSASSQSLAQGASEQAAAIEETTSSVEEMTSMIKQNAGNADEAKGLATAATSAAQKGSDAMGRMSTAIDDIKSSADETAKIIKTIDEIAFQTNLLALNAAVEAARAGEAGKGFAVVAEEVRNLAQRSAEAARNTADMIEGSVRNANNGVTISKEVGESLTEIAQGTGKVNELIAEIAAASNEQAQGIGQINQAVGQMDQVTQSSAATAEESASASEELSAQAEQLQSIVADLAALVGGARASASGSSTFQADRQESARHAQRTGKHTSTSATQWSAGNDVSIPMNDKELADF